MSREAPKSGREETATSSPVRSTGFWAGVRQIYAHMPAARRRQLHFLAGLMLVNAVAELGTIGAVLPLLALIDQPDGLRHFPVVLDTLQALGFATDRERLVAVALMFCGFAIVAGLLRLQLARSTFGFGYELTRDLTLEIHRRLLLQPYSFHVQRNTSTLISAPDKASIFLFDVLLPLMQASIAAFIALFIIAVLIAIAPITAIIGAIIFSVIYILVSALSSGRLAANSRLVSTAINERLKILQESLGGIRDVIIDGSQSTYLVLFERENAKFAGARASTAVIAAAPRFLIETLGIVAITGIALAVSQRPGGFAAALPALGAIALGAQRLLPLIQQVYSGWSTAAGHVSVVAQTVDLLSLPVDEELAVPSGGTPLPLRKAIRLENLRFSYPTRPSSALEGISFEIPAGSSIALVGESGSGKSTLADLLMGLLDPDRGRICIDEVQLTPRNRRRWQQSIAHVPQSIFLADATIASNIALGCPNREIDPDRVVEASRLAQLHQFVDSLPEGYETVVGERGIRLSAGQRQRLGLARAIYKHCPVLVLDEATSALDYQTETAVIDALQELRRKGCTIIIIAHRGSTIRHCDLVARLDQGRLVEFGPVGNAVVI